MAGLYFEEFEVGQVFKHSMTRTVTEMDNVLFSTLTMNPQPWAWSSGSPLVRRRLVRRSPTLA